MRNYIIRGIRGINVKILWVLMRIKCNKKILVWFIGVLILSDIFNEFRLLISIKVKVVKYCFYKIFKIINNNWYVNEIIWMR